MEVFDAIHNRRAVRAYTAQPVDRPTIQRLIQAAAEAPSAVNQQPWSFVVIRGRDALAAIARDARRHLLETIPEDSPMARFKEFVAAPDFDIFYGAPALIVICTTTADAGATEDCALAAENLMLAARALDLGTCWIGLARPWLAHTDCKKRLNVESHYQPVAPIIVGHPVSWPGVTPRREPEIQWIGL